MLNYIWAGLIVSSLVFAIGYDAADLARDTYRNGEPLPVTLTFPTGDDGQSRTVPVRVEIDPETYRSFYGAEAAPPAAPYDAYLVRTQEGTQLRFAAGASFPEPLATIQGSSQTQEGELQGTLTGAAVGAQQRPEGAALAAAVRFAPTRFVKLNAIAASALSSAETAATIALGLIGVLALFLGMLQIAEQAGVIHALVRFVRPVLRPLFPEIPEDHPALGMIALNLAANVFGLGNAATPFGIKAMEEMQTLNPTKDTATNPMVMFLAINTAAVQIVPPVLLLALLGLQINQLIFAIILVTGLSLVVAIVAAKLYGRLPGYRDSDPNGDPTASAPGGAG